MSLPLLVTQQMGSLMCRHADSQETLDFLPLYSNDFTSGGKEAFTKDSQTQGPRDPWESFPTLLSSFLPFYFLIDGFQRGLPK